MQHITRERKPDYDLAIKIANDICDVGIKFDPDKLQSMHDELENKEMDLQQELNDMIGYPINVNSVPQVRDLLESLINDYIDRNDCSFDTEHVINKYLTKYAKGGKKFTTASENLQKLYADFGFKELLLISKIRSTHTYMTKIISPSGKGLLDCLDEDNRVHPTPSLGETHRIAYANPGLSNLSDEIKHCEIPQSDEYSLYELDYSQQELYIMACWWNIEAFKNELANTPDGYTALAKSILNINVLTPEFRGKVKTAWLAKSYGASLETIAQEVGRDFAKTFVDTIEKIPEYAKVKQDIEEKVKNKEYIATSYFGTERNLAEQLKFSNINFVKRALLNNPIQSTGADILSFVLEDVTNFIKEKQLEGLLRICYTVYDSIIVEVKQGHEQLLEELKGLISYQIDDWLPINLKINKIV